MSDIRIGDGVGGKHSARTLSQGYARVMLEAECRGVLAQARVPGKRVLVAVSGGRDSCTLLRCLMSVSDELDLGLVVAHVNHGLRAGACDDDEEFVRDLARHAGLEFVSRSVEPAQSRVGGPSRDRPTLEEAARDLRRSGLLEMAMQTGATWIATAHHAGDQAETVLMRLLRGTGPDGLGGMSPVVEGPTGWIRPFLDVDPAEIGEYARNEGLKWREDASNRDTRFTRNRLRNDWIPGLAETFNPRLLRALCNLAEAQRTDALWIDTLVSAASKELLEIGDNEIRFAIDGWPELPEALARRVVRHALIEIGLDRDLSRRHLERILDFLRAGRRTGRDKILELPHGVQIRRLDEQFQMDRPERREGFGRSDNARVHRRD